MRYAVLSVLMLVLVGCDYGKRLDALEARVSQLETQVAEIQAARKMQKKTDRIAVRPPPAGPGTAAAHKESPPR